MTSKLLAFPSVGNVPPAGKSLSGISLNGDPWLLVGTLARSLRTAESALPTTRPKTVNFCGSRTAALLFRLKKNWSVPLLTLAGDPDSAMAMVPAVLEAANSLLTGGSVGVAGRVVARVV